MTPPAHDDLDRLERLFDRFVTEHRAAADPDPAAFARQAGDRGPALLRMIAAYLDSAPPAWPPEVAIDRLAAGYARRQAQSAAPAAVAPGAALAAMLAEWASAAGRRAAELAARAQQEAIGLTVVTATRGAVAERERFSTLPLDHPQGGRVAVAEDGAVTVALDSVPSAFVGLRPLVAFPQFRAAPAGFEWAGGERGLPDGIVQLAEPVGPEARLRVTIGRLGAGRDGLAELLAEIRVVSEPDAGRDLVWEGG